MTEIERLFTNEFNLDPERIAKSTIEESKVLGVDPRSAFLHLRANLPEVVSASLKEAGLILERKLSKL